VALAAEDFARLRTGDWIDLQDDGAILVSAAPTPSPIGRPSPLETLSGPDL
jgi:hypothetical protein